MFHIGALSSGHSAILGLCPATTEQPTPNCRVTPTWTLQPILHERNNMNEMLTSGIGTCRARRQGTMMRSNISGVGMAYVTSAECSTEFHTVPSARYAMCSLFIKQSRLRLCEVWWTNSWRFDWRPRYNKVARTNSRQASATANLISRFVAWPAESQRFRLRVSCSGR
ncbi:hypothetical protein K440DRAFT_628681 [Wilcoxina mikolae CBS 423.85]|nr:hypothetical protein K440DRAFT_628681 [Wilcoxina mikolae CBS 423.85]